MQQSMQISLLCSTEHKEENMIFINSPFAILDEAFRSLYPDKKYKACIEPSIKDDEGNRVFGFTQFSKGETPVIAISAELNIMDATEIFAHELAHVAAGEGAGHGERWDEEFQRIFDEYNRIGKERFGEDGKEIETAPEYRGGWIRQKTGCRRTMKMLSCGLSISDSENIRDFSRWQASDAHGEASGQDS